MGESNVLLHTKFMVPRLGGEIVPRPQLADKLLANLDKRLICLSAPPGYGKTTLLASFAQQSRLPFLWYQLDVADGDPATFLAYLIEGLRHFNSKPWDAETAPGEAARSLLANLDSSAVVPPQRVLTVLINELSERMTGPWLLILEDYHVITNPVIHDLVGHLLEYGPPQLCVIVSTRSDPPLNLARLRARGLMAEMRTPDLRFSLDEIGTWIALRAPDISRQSIELLGEKTEGWAAGLRLVLSSIDGENTRDIEQFVVDLQGTHRYIYEFLVEEVFQRQPPEAQQFLLVSSILTHMTASACDTLIGSPVSRQMLADLEDNNLFVSCLDENKAFYRYHYLFREFLLAKLRREQPERVAQLEKIAGAYFEGQAEFEVALTHYIRAESFDAAALMIERFAVDYLEHGRAEVLHRYLSMLPEETLHAHALLLLYFGDVLRQLGQAGAAVARYEDALQKFQSVDDSHGACRALISLAEIARSQGDYRHADTLAESALSLAPQHAHDLRAYALMALAKTRGFLSGMDQGRALAEQAVQEARQSGDRMSRHSRASLLRSLGQICWWHGDPYATVKYCQEALQTGTDELSPLAAEAFLTLATPHLYWRDLDRALAYCEKGMEIVQQLQLNELLPRAYMALGSVLARIGDLTRAEDCLQEAMRLSEKFGAETYERVMAAGYLAYDLCQQGRRDEALQQAEAVLWAHAGNPDTYELFVCRSVLADLALDLGDLPRAEKMFMDLMEIGQRRKFRIPLSMVYFGLAYIRLCEHNDAEGSDFARRSLELIEPTGALQLYLDQGERARLVCDALRSSGIGSSFVVRVLDNLPKSAGARTVTVAEPHLVELRGFGPLRVSVGGSNITQEQWVSTKARDLLAYFMTFRHERIPIERVVNAIWPEADTASRTAFHTGLHRLRHALRLTENSSAKFVLVEASEYWLDTTRFDIDIDRFDGLITHAHTAPDREKLDIYKEALDLYHGEYLDNLYYDWILPERRRLNEVYFTALRSAAELYERSGSYAQALALVRRGLEIDFLMEDFQCLSMKYLARIGDRTALVRQFQTLKSVLHDELAVEPLPSTLSLYQLLLEQFPSN